MMEVLDPNFKLVLLLFAGHIVVEPLVLLTEAIFTTLFQVW